MSAKVLILYTKAGAGHESAAKVLQQELTKYNLEVIIFDPLEKSLLGKYLPKIYSFLIEKTPIFWSILIVLWRQRWFMFFCYLLFKQQTLKTLRQKIQEFLDPKERQLVISTYFFLEKLAREILTEYPLSGSEEKINSKQVLTFTIVTEQFSPPKIWFFDKEGNFLVFSNLAEQIALNLGVKESKLYRFGFFFNPKFNRQLTEKEIEEFRKNLNLNCQPTVLILGGGDGLPGAANVFKSLLDLKTKLKKENLDLQILVVCGRDQNLKTKLEKQKQKFLSENLTIAANTIQIFGFSYQIQELINLSNLVISKSGAATIMEVTSQNKPLILNSYIWEQELGNKDFIIKNNLGIYEPNAQEISKLLEKFFLHKFKKQDFSEDRQVSKLFLKEKRINKIQTDFTNLVKFLISKL